MPYQLAKIYAPNYVDTNGEIEVLEDDADTDIGFLGGFLRNVDTRQRLMIRQTLNYTFSEAQQGDQNITLEQRYNDYILRFLTPTGYLKSPTYTYLGNSREFVFVSDYCVESVQLSYYNDSTSEYTYVGEFQSEDNEVWTIKWDNIKATTGTLTNDPIQIKIMLEDQFENTNEYVYNYIVDFDPPQLRIEIGDGDTNYELESASPTTPIEFSNEEPDTAPDSSYTWSEPFTEFQEYMHTIDYPDNLGTSMEFYPNPFLELGTHFPENIVQENYIDWQLDYNPLFTTSSYGSGSFTSNLISQEYYDVPQQPNDFNLINSVSDWSGDLSTQNNDYTTFEATDIDFDYNHEQHTSYNETLWSEDFSTYDGNYMDHIYYPDGYDSSYSMNPLNMQNGFPEEPITENWNEWNLTYNDQYTDSNWYGNGNFDSNLIEHYVSSATVSNGSPNYGSSDTSLDDDDGETYVVDRAEDSYNSDNPTDTYTDSSVYSYSDAAKNSGWIHTTNNHYLRSYNKQNYWIDEHCWHYKIVEMDTDVETIGEQRINDAEFHIRWWNQIYTGGRNGKVNYVKIWNWDTEVWEDVAYNTYQMTGYETSTVSIDANNFHDTNGHVKFKVYGQSGSELTFYWVWLGWIIQEDTWDNRLYIDTANTYVTVNYRPETTIDFNFDSGVLDGIKDYYLYFKGKTNTGIAYLKGYDSGQQTFSQSFDSSWVTLSPYDHLTNCDELKIIADDKNTNTITLDYLYLIPYTSTSSNYETSLTKATTFNGFINHFDGAQFNNYKNEYEVNIEFDYTFTQGRDDFTPVRKFIVDAPDVGGHNNYHSYNLGTSGHFDETFTYYGDNDADSITLKFKAKNGEFQISNMDYDLRYKCEKQSSGNVQLGQMFEVEYNDEQSLSQFEKDNGMFYIDTTYTFNPHSDSYTYENPYGRTNKFEIIYHIKADGQWYSPYYGTSSYESTTRTFYIREFMDNNNLNEFQDFRVEFLSFGDQSKLTVSEVEFYDYRAITPADLEFEVYCDLTEMTEQDALLDIELHHAYKTTNANEMYFLDLYIWNYATSEWDLVDDTMYTSLDERVYEIGSDYHDENWNLQFKFKASSDENYDLLVDQFKILYKIYDYSLDVNAEIAKTITDEILYHYNNFGNYQQKFDIQIDFDYTFTETHTYFPDFAEFSYEGQTIELIKDGQQNHFSQLFTLDDSDNDDSFDIGFEICNGELQFSNMEYIITFKALDLSSHHKVGQTFELTFPEETNLTSFAQQNANLMISTQFDFTPASEGGPYYNLWERTNMLEIILELKFQDIWYTADMYATDSSQTNKIYSFNISEYMIDHHLKSFEDFNLTYNIIGDETLLAIEDITLSYDRNIEETTIEQYRIIDLTSGQEGEWIPLNRSKISILADLAPTLPENFTIEYRVIDRCGNEAINSTYNDGFEYITYNTGIDLTWDNDDNVIDLDTATPSEREISFTTNNFNGQPVEIEINGFNYGTVIPQDNQYTLYFGTENTYNTMILYSDSLMSEGIYSNINPYSHICWETEKKGYFGVTKHVLLDGNINVFNPLSYNATAELDLNHLYERGFSLPDFSRVGQAYYYNHSTPLGEDPRTYLSYYDYLIDPQGVVTFPENSRIHEIYNNSDDVMDGVVYFEYAASEFASQLRLNNADGFFINVSIPAVYYRHSAIEKLTISFNDVFGNGFSKTYYDFDLRTYFMDDVKDEYETTIFGFGKMMNIPLYIDMNELRMSNPDNNVLLDISMLDSVSFDIEDSARWPGSFMEEYENYNVLNLPYQRFIVHDIKLYNYLSDSIQTDENGYVTSEITITAPEYHNIYATEEIKINREEILLTDVSIYNGNEEINHQGSTDIEYSDELTMYFKFDESMERMPFEEISNPIVMLINASNGEMMSMSNCYFITKYDELAPDGYYHNYYFARFPMPQELGEFTLQVYSNGTQVHDIVFDEPFEITVNVIKEQLAEKPIYVEDDVQHLRYGIDTLSLTGCVLDNDQYLVEDEVYEYSWENAYDGESSYTLEFASPYGDDDFISKSEFMVYYLTENNEKRPLYVNYGGEYYKDNEILDPDLIPTINYVNNKFILTMYWNPDSQAFIQYDTHLLISYNVLKGRTVQPTSFSDHDEYGNSLFTNLIEVPFQEYDMISDQWITEDNFIETVQLEKQLLYEERAYESSPIIIEGPKYDIGGEIITLGILELHSIYLNNSETMFYQMVDPSLYNWSINEDGELVIVVDEGEFSTGDTLQIGYHSYHPLTFTHPIVEQYIYSFNVSRVGAYTKTYQLNSSHYIISNDGYRVYLHDIYNTLMVNNFTTNDEIRLHYHANFSKQLDLSKNVILELQNEQGEYIAIDNVELDEFGFFDYQKSFIKSGLNLYLGFGSTINNLRLSYLPSEIHGEPITYVNKYPYQHGAWTHDIRITTEGRKTKLKMVDYAQQPMVVSQSFLRERDYKFNKNPLEALEEGEEFTSLSLDVLAKEDYTFSYKLTDWDDTPIKDAVVWMHIGLMPKSKSGFINERAVIGDGTPIYYDSLGTELLTSKGPGDGPNKMFGKPLTNEIEYPNTQRTSYAPYWWQYAVTNEFGEASFDVSFDQDFMRDFADIFGTIEGINSIEDVVLYHRVFTAPFEWDDMKIENEEQYVCSSDGEVFNSDYAEAEYNTEQQKTNDATYMEGLIRFKKNYISLGINDYLSYDLPDLTAEEFPTDLEDLVISIYASESDPLPTGATYTLDDLSRTYEPSELEPTSQNIFDPDDENYYYAMVDIINPSGVNVLNYTTQFEIEETHSGGYITISNLTMYKMLPAMGPGISTVRMYIDDTEYFRESPIVHIPLEIRPPNYIKFGQKNTLIDLINPFITAWGSVEDANGEEMPFESNYPVLSGAFWMQPEFNASGDEVSLYDQVQVDLYCSLHNDDGSESPFALRSDIPLRPGNIDGVMTFNIPLGPEEAFLMDTECDLNLSFSLDYYQREDLFEQERDIEIVLLDLRLEANPSSNDPTVYWSLYEDQFNSPTEKVTVDTAEGINPDTGALVLGEYSEDPACVFGQPYFEIYSEEQNTYGLSDENALLDLLALSQITPLAVVGTKNGRKYWFEEGSNADWQAINQTAIEFIGITPDEYTLFTIYYEFSFAYGTNSYANMLLGTTNNLNESSIEISFEEGFLPPSNESKAPMFTQFEKECVGTGSQKEFIMDYGIEGITEWDDDLFIIYNEQELENDEDIGSFSKYVQEQNNLVKLIFDSAPINGKHFIVKYGIRSQYELGYGFQKVNQSYSDSVRIMSTSLESSQIVNNDDPLAPLSIEEPALYVDLDGLNESTQLLIEGVPLLHAPEINFSLVFDEILMDYLSSFTGDPNTLQIDFEVIPTNDPDLVFSIDSYEIILDPTDIEIVCESGSNNSYSAIFSRDFTKVYDLLGPISVDVYITITQTGSNEQVIPYIIIEKMDYLCDSHLVEMYDNMPLDRQGELYLPAVINTPHYFQIFTLPLRDDELYDYFPASAFNLIENSKITVSLSDLPYSTLASLDVSQHADYDLNLLGNATTLPVNDENFNMIMNLALFTDAYNIEETVYQQGYLNLFYGEGTEIDGEQYYTSQISMQPLAPINDYVSAIDNYDPTTWEATYEFTNKFISTNEIYVSGSVFYHQMFNISTNSSDIVAQEELAQIVDFDIFEQDVYFGISLPYYMDIESLDSVRSPRSYVLSVQGFPAGDYRDIYGDSYIDVIEDTNGDICHPYQPEDGALSSDLYSYVSTQFGDYIVFFDSLANIENYADENNFLMVDYHAHETFDEGWDYTIQENINDMGSSYIVWDYSFENHSSFNLHPDFSTQYDFIVEFPALEWSEFDEKYIDEIVDEFTFQPQVSQNISALYIDDIDATNVSIRYDIPESEWDTDHVLFKEIHLLIQDPGNRETIKEIVIDNTDPGNDIITQNTEDPYLYLFNFTELNDWLYYNWPNWQVLDESYILMEATYDSDELRYSLSQVPFNYEYTDTELSQYHITLSVNGTKVAASNETEWEEYVYTVANGYIYFKENASINPQDEVTVEYAYKTSPCLLERKEFLMTIYPYSNRFDTPYTDFMGGTSSDAQSLYRESWRKLSAGSITSPFEYSLSIDNMYSLYLSYRLTQRDYFEEEFTIESYNGEYTFDIFERMDEDFANRIEILNNSVTVFYYDYYDEMQFLPEDYYSVDYEAKTITLIPHREGLYDKNLVTASNKINTFYVSFSPEANENDMEVIEHHFMVHRPQHTSAGQSIEVSNWEVTGENALEVIPNLNAFYRMDTENSDFSEYNCYVAQIAAVLNMNHSLRYNISEDLSGTEDALLDGIHAGNYPTLYINTRIENMETLEYLTITLFNEEDSVISEQIIARETLAQWSNELIIDLPTSANTLEYITFTPTFREDGPYIPVNTKGISRMEYAQWDSNDTDIDEENGVEYYMVPLEYEIIADPEKLEVAYIFNEKLQYLTFPENASYKVKEEEGYYYLKIPLNYYDPEENATLLPFEDEQFIAIKYYSPIEKEIGITLGEFYFEKDKQTDLPTAEFMLINANGTSEQYYEEFTDGYYYSFDLPLTPFDTEYSGSYKTQIFEMNISQLEGYADNETGLIDFSDMLFTVNDPFYELTVEQFAFVENDEEPLISYGSDPFKRIWQYTEFEVFYSDATPEDDAYQLALNNTPLFYELPNATWLDYIQISDEQGYYYTAGLEGDQHALHYDEATQTLTWNENYTGIQEQFGFNFETSLIIEPNSTLFVEYAINDSWREPITIEYENINIESLLVEYAYDIFDPYLMGTHDEFADILDPEYTVMQYYQEIFEVYEETDTYTFNLSISQYPGNYSLLNDFENVSVYSVIGIKPTFETEILITNPEFEIIFDMEDESITVTDLNETDGLLDVFDTISIILNFTTGPISSYTEITLLDEFWNEYLGTYDSEDLQESFYSSLEVSFSSVTTEGIQRVIAGESKEMIVSEYTYFEAISYCRNTEIAPNNVFYQYGHSEMFATFDRYYDPFNIIYMADTDNDGNTDYKQTVDIDKDYTIDIIKYGCENDEGMIVWHTIIQEFHSVERTYEFTEAEKLETLWFDLRDSTMEGFWGSFLDPFNLQGSLTMSLQNSFQLNYFGKKVIESETELTQIIKKDYYSVRLDYDKDGYADQEIVHRKIDATIDHKIMKTMKFLIAAKPNSIYDSICSKIDQFIGGYQPDPTFNPLLTEDVLDQSVLNFIDMSALEKYVFLTYFQVWATVLLTYRKFILHDTKLYTQEIVSDELIYRDWEEGEIVEERIYMDQFSEDEMDPHSELLFGDIMEENKVTNIETGEETEVSFDPFVPFASPSNISWDTPTWGEDNVPIYYDALTVANDTYAEYKTNYYERTVTITFLTRSSVLYDYGDKFSYPGCTRMSQFEVTGVFITPPDGVYVSSDKLAFVLDFKVGGHYLYYDSNQFGEGTGDDFYDTVYVLSPGTLADGSYLVYSIVYNYDGEHDVKPYTIVGNGWDFDAREIFTIAVTSLSYPFCDTIREFFIDHIMNIFTLEEQDSIFELYKSTMSAGAYPMLFAEARRETYNRAWEVFGERMWEDFWEQTIMISIAMVIGGILKAIPFTSALGGAAFMLTYTILMKYFMDEKAAVAASKEASEKFYTLGSRPTIPLNDRMIADRVSRDSSLAAIQGHPAAYYTLIHGGPTGHDYTAEVIASPPNEMRTSRATLGMAAYVATLGQIPELFFGLDFDYSNIDYEQFTTALYTYNDYPFYTYYHKGLFGIPKMSDPYQYNTLGYVEQKITGASTAMNAMFGDAEPILDEIRPVSYDGAVRYVFEKRSHTSPVSPLFQPIVLSEPRYNFLKKLGMVSPGHLGITVKHTGSIGSLGMNPYGLTAAESLHYGAKIPLAFNKTFGYPIISISLGIKHGLRTIDTITIPEDMYEVKGGNLFITTSLEDLAKTSDKYNAFVGADAESIPHNMYYTMEVTFHRFVPFSAEYEGLALAQVGHYAVMDQVHQYTFAEISSNMIAEIGYTEVLTLMSTLASAPAMIFYSYASFKAEQEVGTKVLSEFVKGIHKVLFRALVVAPISEMIEELTIDVILEGLIEGYLREWGYSDNFGQWCSLLATSVREGVSLSERVGKTDALIDKKMGYLERAASLEAIQDKVSERSQKNIKKALQLGQKLIADVENKIRVRNALKMAYSTMFAVASMGFGGFSLAGMSNLIGSSFKVLSHSTLATKVSKNARMRAGYEQMSKNLISSSIETLEGLDMDPSGSSLGSQVSNYHQLLKDLNTLASMAQLLVKASNIDSSVNSEADEKTTSISTTYDKTETQQRLEEMTAEEQFEHHYKRYAQTMPEYEKFEDIRQKIDEAYQNAEQLGIQEASERITAQLVVGRKALLDDGCDVDARVFDMQGVYAIDPHVLLVGFSYDELKRLTEFTEEDYRRLDTSERAADFERKYKGKKAYASQSTLDEKKTLTKDYKQYLESLVGITFKRGAYLISKAGQIKDYSLREGTGFNKFMKEIHEFLQFKGFNDFKLGLLVVEGDNKVHVPSSVLDIELYCKENGIEHLDHSTFMVYKSYSNDQYSFDQNKVIDYDRYEYGKGAFVQTPGWEQKVRDEYFKDNNIPASPYYDKFISFRDLLFQLCRDLDIKVKIDGNYEEIDSLERLYALMGTTQSGFKSIKDNLERGRPSETSNEFYFKPEREDFFDKYLANIIIEIYQQEFEKPEGSRDFERAANRVDIVKNYFHTYYSIFGYTHTEFYREARLYRYIISEYLYSNTELSNIKDMPSSVTPKYSRIYFDKNKNPKDFPNPYRANLLLDNTIKYLKSLQGIDSERMINFLKYIREFENWDENVLTTLNIRKTLRNYRGIPFKENFLDELLDYDFFKKQFASLTGIDKKDETSIGTLSNYLFDRESYIRDFLFKGGSFEISKLIYSILKCWEWSTDGPRDGLKWPTKVSESELKSAQIFYTNLVLEFLRKYSNMNTEMVFKSKDIPDEMLREHLMNEYLRDKLNVFAFVYIAYATHYPPSGKYERPSLTEIKENLYPNFEQFITFKTSSSYFTLDKVINEITEWKLDLQKGSPDYEFKKNIYEATISALRIFRENYPHKKFGVNLDFKLREDWVDLLFKSGLPLSSDMFSFLFSRESERSDIDSLAWRLRAGLLDNVLDVLSASSQNGLTSKQEDFQFKSEDLKNIKRDFIKLLEDNNYFLKYDGTMEIKGISDIAKKLFDYAANNPDGPLDLNDHERLDEYLKAMEETVGVEIPKKLIFNLDYSDLEDPSIEGQIGGEQRIYTGHTDLFFIKDGVLYIADFKPDIHFSSDSDSLSDHVVNVFPQLITYALIMQEKLKNDIELGYIKEVRCVVFNKEGAVEFDPNIMFYQVFDFMNDFAASKWHNSLFENGKVKPEYKNGYEGGVELDDYGYEDMDPKDDLKKWFIDFSRIADINVLKNIYGKDFYIYKQLFEQTILEYKEYIGNKYIAALP
jgi:hypothetical protein